VARVRSRLVEPAVQGLISLIGASPATAPPDKRMHERQKLYDNLKRYRALRNLKK
jgi:hypothetical protein